MNHKPLDPEHPDPTAPKDIKPDSPFKDTHSNNSKHLPKVDPKVADYINTIENREFIH